MQKEPEKQAEVHDVKRLKQQVGDQVDLEANEEELHTYHRTNEDEKHIGRSIPDAIEPLLLLPEELVFRSTQSDNLVVGRTSHW